MLSLEAKIQFIQSEIHDPTLALDLSEKFAARTPDYRINIRQQLQQNHQSHFNPQQFAALVNLKQLPVAQKGFFSISHAQALGGFSFSKWPHGFDIEEKARLTEPIISRITDAAERADAPSAQYLWVAKEAVYKSFAGNNDDLVVTHFTCKDWKSHSETEVFSFRVHSKKTLEQNLNRGFVFSEKDILFAIYFK